MMKQKSKSVLHKTLRSLLLIFVAAAIFYLCVPVEAATNSKYLIKVNKQQNCITIYTKDDDGNYTVPYKAMVCSTGYATPTGTYNTMVKYRWKILLDDVWGQYCTRIVGSVLFHSVWYYEKDPSTLSATQYNKLGTTCSHGCIRLTVEDAKWLYDNCPTGTTVIIYNSSDPGPLGKPTSITLPAGTGWDPTDPDPDNPIYGESFATKPTLSGLKNYSVAWGSSVDLLENVTATSYKGTDITSKIKVTGKVDTQTAGVYKVKYSVTDSSCNKTTTKTIKITVKECTYKVKLKGVADRAISNSQKVSKAFCLEGVSAYFGPDQLSSDHISVKITHDTIDEYKVVYTAKSDTGKTKKKTAYFHVDTTAPIMTGVAHKLVYGTKTELTDELLLEGITVTDDYAELTTSDIQITKKKVSDYSYLVTYEVTDDVGNIAQETVQVTYANAIIINGVANRTVPKGTEVNEAYALEGITADNAGKDLTSKIQVTISDPVDGVYTVTYTVSNSYGVTTEIIAFFTMEQ